MAMIVYLLARGLGMLVTRLFDRRLRRDGRGDDGNGGRGGHGDGGAELILAA